MSHIAGIGPGSALAVVALAAFTAANAGGESSYVATDGDDAHAGTKTAPFRTIQKAASVVRAGDTVLVRAGVYKGHVYLRISGEPGKPVVFKNYPGERPVVEGEGRGRIELQSENSWQKPPPRGHPAGSLLRGSKSATAGTGSSSTTPITSCCAAITSTTTRTRASWATAIMC